MKFSFSSVNSVWHNYIVPLQCADIINNYWLRIVQMPRTRSAGAGDDDDDLPLPPPPTPTELITMLAEGHRTMAKASIRLQIGMAVVHAKDRNQINTVISRISLTRNPPSSRRLRSPYKLMSGWILSSRSFVCSAWLRCWRLSMHLTNCMGRLVFGGVIIGPLCPLMPKSLGISSSLLSGEITFLLVSWRSSI